MDTDDEIFVGTVADRITAAIKAHHASETFSETPGRVAVGPVKVDVAKAAAYSDFRRQLAQETKSLLPDKREAYNAGLTRDLKAAFAKAPKLREVFAHIAGQAGSCGDAAYNFGKETFGFLQEASGINAAKQAGQSR